MRVLSLVVPLKHLVHAHQAAIVLLLDLGHVPRAVFWARDLDERPYDGLGLCRHQWWNNFGLGLIRG